MRFGRLRLQGFKSFVDPVELRIEDGLTGVVGPNGCGKSNLLEAIRWVMGEASPKSMRGGGMDDVIFAGTDRRPSRDTAQVTLHLDNTDRRAPAQFNDSEEIEVGRHIERGLGSAYRVNGRDVRQRDVQLLFADAATGAHSPALVSQGRIGGIIAAKPQDRRQLLEEAAGIAGLHVRRKDAEQRLRAAEANLLRLDDLLQAIEAQAAGLKRQARQADRYKKLSAQIRTAEAMLLFAKWRDAANEAAAARCAASAVQARIDEATRAAATISALQAEAQARLPELRRAEAEAAAVLQRLSISREALAVEIAEVERRRIDAEAREAAARRDIEREAALASDAEAALARLVAEADSIAARLAAANAAIAPAAARIEALEAAAESDHRDLAAALSAQAEAHGERRALEAELISARREAQRAEAEIARENAASDQDTDDIAARIELAAAAAAAGEAAAQRAANEFAEAESLREGLEAARDAALGARAEAQGALSALISERQSLERMLAAPDDKAEPLIGGISVAPGYEAAFAAAFGDDSAAPVGGGHGRRWAGAEVCRSDPVLPAGVMPLAKQIGGPPEIARRIAQVGIAQDAEIDGLAAELAPGQRLVTTTGRLIRWDGFRADPETVSGTAEVLRQRNRLSEIEKSLAAAEDTLIAAESAALAARAAVASLAQRSETARTALRVAEAERSTAERAVADLSGEAARRAVRAEARQEVIARTAAIIAAAAARIAAAEAGLASLPATGALADAVMAARNIADTNRSALVTARAEQVGLQRGFEADLTRQAAISAERGEWQRRVEDSAGQRRELAARIEGLDAELGALSDAPVAIAARQTALTSEIVAAEAVRQAAADRLAAAETQLRSHDAEARSAAEVLSVLREERGRLEAGVENQDLHRAELDRLAGERFGCSPQMLPGHNAFDEEMAADVSMLTAALSRLIDERERMGPVNLRAETELAEIEATLATSGAEREELETAIARLRGSIGALNREGRARLLTAFEAVNRHFGELFTGLFGGGEARLELVESDDPLEAGLEIMAQPPGKKLQSMTLLSGGEQALTAIALIFALFLTNPAPICILDEVDAPLDDANIERFCDLLDRMTGLTDTRFLIVTHNAVTMSRMHRLYGVTMAEKGVSQLVSVDLGRAETLLAAE